MQTKYNKFLYAGFIILGVYFALITRNYFQGSVNLGIALLFDPFDQDMPWNARPRWQKAILLSHVALVFVMMIVDLIQSKA